MSFPSAVEQINAGATPVAALLYAMQHDTSIGYKALVSAVASVSGEVCPCCVVREALPAEHHNDVLRAERRGDGIVIDFNPDSKVGKQIARLMGTDAARPLLSEHLGTHFGFANCCKVLISHTPADVRFTVQEQIEWQHSIDC